MPALRLAPSPDPLVLAAQRGEPGAAEALIQRHGPLVWGICRRLCPDPEDAWQEIWERVLRALPGYDPLGPAQCSTWIATIAHRVLVDRHRRRRVRGEVLEAPEIPDTTPAIEDRLDARRRAARLEEALMNLPQPWREVVVLHHLHGVDLDTLAAQEGVAVGTIKSRLHRGRAALAMALEGGR